MLTVLSPNREPIHELRILPASQEHRNYIISTWVRSYLPTVRKLTIQGPQPGIRMRFDETAFRASESKRAEGLWVHTSVVSGVDDTYSVHAWVAAEPGKLYHVYVPPGLRGIGIARALIEATAGTKYTVSKPMPVVMKNHTVTYAP
jgi:hypothetical protein